MHMIVHASIKKNEMDQTNVKSQGLSIEPHSGTICIVMHVHVVKY